MAPGASRPLTERQSEVMQRIDRRVPIKIIAKELGVSETRVNQHIRALKDLYKVSNLADLVVEYRAHTKGKVSPPTNAKEENLPEEFEEVAPSLKGYREPAYSFSQVPRTVFGFDMGDRDKAATVEMNDVLPMIERAPWLKPGEPKVVPGLLDGEYAVMFRLAAIVGIAFGFLAAVVLTVTAAVTLSEAMAGRADIPVDERGFS